MAPRVLKPAHMRTTPLVLLIPSLFLACTGESPTAIEGTAEDEAVASASAGGLLVAIEGGGAVELDPRTGAVRQTYATGANAFGAIFTADGSRAFVTDKDAGTLVEIDPSSSNVIATINVGRNPQQPAIAPDGRIYIPLSGDAAIAVVDASATPQLVRTISTGAGSKPHIVSLSPDGSLLWATIQGTDPRVVYVPILASGEGAPVDVRYDLVPRVIQATNSGALFTAHHSTGLHRATPAGAADTPYVDVNGEHSEPRKQIEGVSANADGSLAAITHEGRRAVVVVRFDGGGAAHATADIGPLSAAPYWVTLDPGERVLFVSIPGSGDVEAYSTGSGRKLWSTHVGGKPKRMAVRPGGQAPIGKVINFGTTEARQGRLNAADGNAPIAGEPVVLRVYLEALSQTLCGAYCMALHPQLWVRFDGSSAFTEITNLPHGEYVMRGPQAAWSQSVADVALDVPANADRIEAYMYFGRISWNGGTCYLAYDMTECPDSFPIDGAWLSNYGRNFRIDARR
jgi:YVTN family beta-propeller protein